MDKPITTPLLPSTNPLAAKQIFQDYLDLEYLHKRSNAKFYVMCQRRNHEGYAFIKKYLTTFISQFVVPISYIDIYHSDGAWSLPHEFFKENHPYKYGYGKLMHSGYHFIDLFSYLADLNTTIPRAKPNNAKLYTARFTPNDLFNQIDKTTCNKLFGSKTIINDFYNKYKRKNYEHFGELDAHILLQLMHGQSVVTTGSIHLQQNSFSKRSWFDLPEDTYKGNGRVRHERVNIQISHLLNLQVHSYQSRENNPCEILPGEIGDEDHFDILIFRNNKLVGGEGFAKFSVGKEMANRNKNDSYYLGHNEKARETTLLHFINQESDESEFQNHRFTNKLLSKTYESIAENTISGNAQINFKM